MCVRGRRVQQQLLAGMQAIPGKLAPCLVELALGLRAWQHWLHMASLAPYIQGAQLLQKVYRHGTKQIVDTPCKTL